MEVLTAKPNKGNRHAKRASGLLLAGLALAGCSASDNHSSPKPSSISYATPAPQEPGFNCYIAAVGADPDNVHKLLMTVDATTPKGVSAIDVDTDYGDGFMYIDDFVKNSAHPSHVYFSDGTYSVDVKGHMNVNGEEVTTTCGQLALTLTDTNMFVR